MYQSLTPTISALPDLESGTFKWTGSNLALD